LAQGYWKPSYHYLRLHWRLPAEAAEDAVQAFFAVAFEKNYIERYDPAKAKFRTFLRVCLDQVIFMTSLFELDTLARRAEYNLARMQGDVRIFDVPYWRGPAQLIHLMSVISPVADDLAVVYLPLLPVGLWRLIGELGIRLIEVPDEEFPTLGCNVLAVRPGVVILAEGNPRTAAALATAGCEVHTYPATEIGVNGSGGPTCMTRPILRG
jgi:hypothetical protein